MNILSIRKNWPEVFTRKKAEQLTGGGIDARTLANLDCMQQGPPGRFKIGRKTMYLREPFLEWLRGRIEVEQCVKVPHIGLEK